VGTRRYSYQPNHRSAGYGARVHSAHKPRRRRRPEADPALQRVLDTCPGYNLGKAYKNVTRLFEEEFRESELTLPQFAVLVNTGLTDSATASQVAERLGSDLSTISRTMEIVVRRGLVSQERGHDRRVRVYRLTPQGRRVLDGALEQWKRAKRRILADLDSQEWHKTLNALHELAHAPGQASA
jgi:DNA-binding MarR family transcriptional regulator